MAFLLDENLEDEVLHRLQSHGYDVAHVADHPDLGKGADDETVAKVSRRDELVIVTYDPDFVVDYDDSTYFGAVFFGDESLSARDVSRVLHTMATAYPKTPFEGLQFGGRTWL